MLTLCNLVGKSDHSRGQQEVVVNKVNKQYVSLVINPI